MCQAVGCRQLAAPVSRRGRVALLRWSRVGLGGLPGASRGGGAGGSGSWRGGFPSGVGRGRGRRYGLVGGSGVMKWTQIVELALLSGGLVVLLVVLVVKVGRRN
jgi:hypothetical protein